MDNATLLRKRAALSEFYRFHAARGSAPPVLGGMTSGTQRATGDFIPMPAHTMSGPVERSPLRVVASKKRPNDLTDDDVSLLQDALGLRHSDLDPAANAVHVVARDDNPNHARVKGMKDRSVPVRDYLFLRYADYLDAEYGDLDNDFVFAAALARNQRLQQRVDTLTEQNSQQRQQLERAYAEIRRLQVSTPSGLPGPTK